MAKVSAGSPLEALTSDESVVEEFYNSCHDPKSGRFCGRGKGGKFPKRAIIVPMSAKAKASYDRANAYMRRKRAWQKSQASKAAGEQRKSRLPAKFRDTKPGPEDDALRLTRKYGGR